MLNINGKALCKIDNSVNRGEITFKSTSGEGVNNTQVISETLNSMSVFVGVNSASPTSEDYTMDMTNQGLTIVNTTGTNDSTPGHYNQNYIAIFTRTFRNDTDSDVTVCEVGIIGSGRGPFSNSKDFLFARDVIDPVTIAPGEAYTFTMYIG